MMQIVIIAGGEGKRLQPLSIHKSLLPILGKPLIVHLLDSLKAKHAKFTLVTSPSALTPFHTALADYDLSYVLQSQPLGMADALLSASAKLDLDMPTLIVSAGKLQVSSNYGLVLEQIAKDPTSPHLASYEVSSYKEGGYLQIEGDRAVGVIENPGPDKLPSSSYKLVLDYFPHLGPFIQALKQSHTDRDDRYEQGLSRYLLENPAKIVYLLGGHTSLKHAHHVLDVMDLALEHYLVPGISKSAHVSKTAIIDKNVMVESGATIHDYAVIKGPSYIGKNVVVGNGALIRQTCIEEGSQVGYGSEVARSYLGPGTKGHMMYVGDSIIEGEVNLSAGTILANRRFDNTNIQASMPRGRVDTGRRKFGAIIARGVMTGVHSSLMPGTVLGRGVTTPPGSVVKGYIKA